MTGIQDKSEKYEEKFINHIIRTEKDFSFNEKDSQMQFSSAYESNVFKENQPPSQIPITNGLANGLNANNTGNNFYASPNKYISPSRLLSLTPGNQIFCSNQKPGFNNSSAFKYH